MNVFMTEDIPFTDSVTPFIGIPSQPAHLVISNDWLERHINILKIFTDCSECYLLYNL